MSEVESFWPQSLPTDALLEGAATLRDNGIDTVCRIQPVRRSAGLSVLILLTTSALEPLLKTFFEQVGEDAWQGLRHFVGRFIGDEKAPEDPVVRPEAVVFESAATGAQFIFTAGLPVSAFREAIELDPGDGPGRWSWDGAQERWMRFEELAT
jgi:hypothetical protein